MIIDTLDNFKNYVNINPLFEKVYEFMKKNDLQKLENGKQEIDGKDLFVNVQDAKGRDMMNAVLETHREMIDIQIPISGEETFGYTPLTNLPDVEYNEEKDITKYEGPAESYVTCHPGMFAIFFPSDGHAPCITTDETIHKVIFKVKNV